MDSFFNPPIILMLAVMVAGASAFVVGAMIWLRRLRQNLAHTLGEALTRQIQHGHKVEEALGLLQRNQKQMDAQLQTLVHAQARLRADVTLLAHKIDRSEVSAEAGASQGRLLH